MTDSDKGAPDCPATPLPLSILDQDTYNIKLLKVTEKKTVFEKKLTYLYCEWEKSGKTGQKIRNQTREQKRSVYRFYV